jgi:hypothetical protein
MKHEFVYPRVSEIRPRVQQVPAQPAGIRTVRPRPDGRADDHVRASQNGPAREGKR